MNVLVACEKYQVVCKAFRSRGHNAFSCDIVPSLGNKPEWHILTDVIGILNGGEFVTEAGTVHYVEKWDLIIAHPPCTYLCNSGNRWFNVDRYGEKAIIRREQRRESVEFFLLFVDFAMNNNVKMAIENPIGIMSTYYRKPDQIIQPYYFGHPVRKSTCLWLWNLPLLKPTNLVEYECIHSAGKSGGYSGPSWLCRDESGKILSYNDPRVSSIRSKTYEGIGKAMAEQWG